MYKDSVSIFLKFKYVCESKKLLKSAIEEN